ncbi:MAG: hypothetical protein JST22_12355 [Bacteroidetes bacterium]|nr:hypothetical protein [Bacteroidota bacterium]
MMELIMRTDVSLKQEVAERLPWLFQEFGFRVVKERFDPEIFGNSYVTLESRSLRVRFVRDRGQIFADVASLSEPEAWWHMEHVCQLVVGRNVESGFGLSELAALLRDNYSALADYLGPKFAETKRELTRRAEERKQAILRRFPP